jgi:hypothetical protein
LKSTGFHQVLDQHAQFFNHVPCINDSFFSHLSSEDISYENNVSSTSLATPVGRRDKPRVNPFSEDRTNLRRNASSVTYRDKIPVSQPQSSGKSHQPSKMLEHFVNSETSSSKSTEDPQNRYDIPSMSYHPKLVRQPSNILILL